MAPFHCALLFLAAVFINTLQVDASGSLYDPPNRAVMWKYGFKTQKNYNYMQLNCGGIKQPENGTFNCGICGDPPGVSGDHIRGGRYGSATISRYYPAGIKEIPIKVELLAFEKGFFEFRICPANNNTATQECLDENLLPIKEGYLAGTPMRFYPKAAGDHRLTIAINPKLVCDRCVLQWGYHTANSWGTDPVTNKEGLGLGPQDEFRNCADIRIGGAVPNSVRNNPFFGPSIKNIASSTTVDTPQDDRKSMVAEERITASLSVQPEHADHVQPTFRSDLFKESTQSTGGQSTAWIEQVLNEGQGDGQGNIGGPIVHGSWTSGDQSGNVQFGVDASTNIDAIKNMIQPADARIRLTAGTDIIKVGSGEGRMRKIKQDGKVTMKNTMSNIDGQMDGQFDLNNQLGVEGGVNYDNEATTMDSTGLTGAMHTIAAGVLGSSISGHNLELSLPDVSTMGGAMGGDNNMGGVNAGNMGGASGFVPLPQNPEPTPKESIAITEASVVGGPSTDPFGTMRSATRSAFGGEGSLNLGVDGSASNGGGTGGFDNVGMESGFGSVGGDGGFGMMTGDSGFGAALGGQGGFGQALVDGSFKISGQGFDMSGNANGFANQGGENANYIMESSATTSGSHLGLPAGFADGAATDSASVVNKQQGTTRLNGNTGNNIVYNSVTTEMNSVKDQFKMRNGTGQRIFQIKVHKPLNMAEGVQPSVDISAGSRASIATDASTGTSSSIGQSASTSDQYNVVKAGASTTDTATDTLAPTSPANFGQQENMNAVNDIDALRAGLIKSSLRQGGGSGVFANRNAVAESITYTEDINTPAGTVSEANIVQKTTSPTPFDGGVSNSFIEQNIDAIVNQANEIMKSSGSGSIAVDNSAMIDSLSKNLATDPNMQSVLRKSIDTVLSSVKKEKTGNQAGVEVRKNEKVTINQDNKMGQQNVNKNTGIINQQGGVFFESLGGDGFGDGFNLASIAGKQLGGSTIDLSIADNSNRLVAENLPSSPGVETRVITKQLRQNQQPDRRVDANVRTDTRTRINTGAGSMSMGGQASNVDMRATLGIRGGSDVLMPETRSGDRRGASRTNIDSVNIERQLSSFKLDNIPQDNVMNADQQRRNNDAFRLNGDARASGRRDIDRNINGFRGESRVSDRRGTMRNTDVRGSGDVRGSDRRTFDRTDNVRVDRTRVDARGGNRMESSTRDLRVFDESRTFGPDRSDRRGGEMPMPDRRGGSGGFRIIIDPRTGLEMRVPADDARFRGETARPFGRRAGDMLMSDLGDRGSRRPSGDSRSDPRRQSRGPGDFIGDRRRVETRIVGRTRERLPPFRERMPPLDRRVSRERTAAIRTRAGPEEGRGGSRDPKYFVDMTGVGQRVNISDVVIERGGLQEGRAMPRDAVAAFDAVNARRRELSGGTSAGGSARRVGSDARIVIEGDLSRGDMTSDRGSRRDSSSGTGRRSDSRDRRRDSGTRRDGRRPGDGGGMRVVPMGPMPFGGFPGAGMAPGGVGFGGPGGPMLPPPGGMPMMGGPFGGGPPGGPFPPMGGMGGGMGGMGGMGFPGMR